jgi:hypothetical protein
MSRWGISGAALPEGFPFALEIANVCAAKDFPPCLVGAMKANETGASADPKIMQIGTWPGSDYLTNAAGNGPDPTQNAGHGPYQLTYSWPSNWDDPTASTAYAIDNFLQPAVDFWVANKFGGDNLVKAVLASYNAGTNTVWGYHVKYNDLDGVAPNCTTDKYGARGLTAYTALVSGKLPW